MVCGCVLRKPRPAGTKSNAETGGCPGPVHIDSSTTSKLKMVCSMADGTCLLIAWLAASQLASSGLDTGEPVGGRGNGLSLMRAATLQHGRDSDHRPRGAERRSASTQPSDDEEDEENEQACDVDEFFNVREANANMDKGSWALELPVGWATRSDHHRDEVTAGALLNYGLTNDAY